MDVLEPFRRISDTMATTANLDYLSLTQNDLIPILGRLASMPNLKVLSLCSLEMLIRGGSCEHM